MQLPVDHKWVFVSNSYGMMVKRSHRNHSRCSILRPHVGVIWTYLVEPQFPHCIWPKLTIVPMNQPSTNHRPDFPAVKNRCSFASAPKVVTRVGSQIEPLNSSSNDLRQLGHSTTESTISTCSNGWTSIYIYIHIHVIGTLND